ncbi:DUF1499 domain-containing protein [Vibrio sp.]|uniref:DUF1499 domain-containing protein n=1 Tax=Vibrio sp. TaxID=678 RepID=UPI003AA7C3DD
MRKLSTLAMVILLTGCTQSYAMKDNNPDLLCSSKPNCVSTQELRSDYQVAPFELISEATTINEIEQVALTLKRSKTVNKTDESLHLESTSLIFRFVDDLHIVKQGSLLQVRSKSRVGYSDFGVNKSRVEALREKLIAANLLKPSP